MTLRTLRPILLLALAAVCSVASAQNVKITPLGSHAGELCARDRATIFEDPTGVRILYDAGQSVLGGDERASAGSTSSSSAMPTAITSAT